MIRGYGLDKDEYDYHLIQITQSKDGGQQQSDVWDKTLRFKCYNYLNNLLYVVEKKDNLIVERLNMYFILDSKAQIYMFDLDKALI